MKQYDNELVKKYEALKDQEKIIKAEIETIRQQFIEGMEGQSEEYNVFVIDQYEEHVKSKPEFEKKFGKTWLKENDMIKIVVKNIVKVQRKIERKVG